ncbi:MAG: hypothetical protein H0A76_09000 [Candidatus Thiodubiliella endoseptemdiera]|uniref:Bacterial Ig-like domain-containing protein n=1 Tax=Candidatus Thiodubiliella endoseptemdiera TaxID=2738886 RepID=A0A853F261_9GAMM|nr:hypothetical protein [Candidatus Thiodubiliella endoseptemdiera]
MDLVVTTEYKTYYYHNIQRPIIDTTPPEAPLIKIHDTSLATGDTTLVEFHFKEKVLDFTTDDITAENASLSGFGQNTGLGPFVWTAILTPDTGITDSINTLTIGTDWHDAAGNKPSQPSTSVNYKVIDQTHLLSTLTPVLTPTTGSSTPHPQDKNTSPSATQ